MKDRKVKRPRIRQAVRELLALGIYPSVRQVSQFAYQRGEGAYLNREQNDARKDELRIHGVEIESPGRKKGFKING